MARKNPIHIANWSERHYARNRFVLSFGCCAPTYVMVFATHLEEALEHAAEWLAENEPGHIMLEGHGNDKRDPQLDALMAEACKELGLTWPIPEGTEDFEPYWDAEQQAYADLTYTESGYLASYEWGIALENPTATDVLELAGDTGW